MDLLTAERDLANARYTHVLSRAELLIGAARVAWAAGTVERATVPIPHSQSKRAAVGFDAASDTEPD